MLTPIRACGPDSQIHTRAESRARGFSLKLEREIIEGTHNETMDKMTMRMKVSPAVVLLVLSPLIGELLSGSAPPTEFFTPFGLTTLIGLYGCGALVIREIKFRWRKGIGSILLLGAAYAILEEGIMVASFFNPNWQDLGVLKGFGRWLEINWVWTVELTIYHAIISVTVPIMLVELLFPRKRNEPWLSDKWLKIVAIILGLDVIIGFFLFSTLLDYSPPLLQYVFMILVMISFVVSAHRFPSDWMRRGNKSMRKPVFYGALAFAGSLGFAIIFGILPGYSDSPIFPVIVIFLGVGLILGIFRILKRYKWRKAGDMHRFALAAGSLLIFILAAPIQELDTTRTDNPSGMILVGLTALLCLIFLWRIVRKRDADITN
jgi:hypothetical protein